ncbi:GntR family transcriptional regulator [Anaerotignum sp.]|uniref:GntR family transcriptional regulator n=1 Tax=Anaerotignum sp. TaxID=2039241 RepID=UPI00332E5704
MKKIRNRKELYFEILKSFYQGKYVYGDKFMTQLEAKEYYQVARPTVEKVYKMLQEEGFLTSKRHVGSIVTFNPIDETHFNRIPIDHNNPGVLDFYTYYFPRMTMARAIYEGLCWASEEGLKDIQKDIHVILERIREGKPFVNLVSDWYLKLITSIQNPFLANIMDHYYHRVIYFNRCRTLPSTLKKQIDQAMKDFFEGILVIIQAKEHEKIFPHYYTFYDRLFSTPDLLFFSKGEFNEQRYFEHSQYSRLLHELLISIHIKGVKKGEILPTIDRISEMYKVSGKTARDAYDVLVKNRIAVRRQRTGTMLIAQLDDDKVREWTAKNFEEQKVGIYYILETLRILATDYMQCEWETIPSNVIQKMKDELNMQHRDEVYSHAPYFVSDILVTPIIMNLPMGVLQKYYFYVHKPASEFVNVCGLELWFYFNKNDEVYDLLVQAISALEEGDHKTFVYFGIEALQLNMEIIMQTCEKGFERHKKRYI